MNHTDEIPGSNSRPALPTFDFDSWARTVSQTRNRSLAGARLVIPEEPASMDSRDFTSKSQQWGLAQSAVCNGYEIGENNSSAFDLTLSDGTSDDFDVRTKSGAEAIDYAQRHMPIFHTIMEEVGQEGSLDGVAVAACLILEPKTAVLLRELRDAGARVGVCCESGAVDQRVADQLKGEDIIVEANASWNDQEALNGALRLLDTLQPRIIIDDGASFARLASRERPDLAERLIGVAEETTSGVRAFEAMEEADALAYPVIAVNDSLMKSAFDNAHGTGETCVSTIQEILGTHCFSGMKLAVVGYGPVGSGFARRARSLGAQVSICDTDPTAALKAVFDGFESYDIDQMAPQSDMMVSATGVRHTIGLSQMTNMREGAIIAVIGGIADEIALDQIEGFRMQTGRRVRSIQIPHGPKLTLLAEGDGVNYTAGGGNPIEIMDLSFAVQASAVSFLLAHQGTLSRRVRKLDACVDRRIASIALKVRGYRSSHAPQDNGYTWRMTRFDKDTW